MRAASSDLPIRFDAVTVRRGAVIMLERITLQIEAGTPTVLIGPNGSGKTTFLRTATGGGAHAAPRGRRAGQPALCARSRRDSARAPRDARQGTARARRARRARAAAGAPALGR